MKCAVKYEDIVEEAWEPLHAHESIVSLQDSLDHLAEIYGAMISEHIETFSTLSEQIAQNKSQQCLMTYRIHDLERMLERERKPRRERTPEEEAEWLEDKRCEYEADRICGHHWSNI